MYILYINSHTHISIACTCNLLAIVQNVVKVKITVDELSGEVHLTYIHTGASVTEVIKHMCQSRPQYINHTTLDCFSHYAKCRLWSQLRLWCTFVWVFEQNVAFLDTRPEQRIRGRRKFRAVCCTVFKKRLYYWRVKDADRGCATMCVTKHLRLCVLRSICNHVCYEAFSTMCVTRHLQLSVLSRMFHYLCAVKGVLRDEQLEMYVCLCVCAVYIYVYVYVYVCVCVYMYIYL